MRRVGIDTPVLIYHLEDVSPYVGLTTPLLTRVAGGHLQLVVSAITLSELLVKPLQTRESFTWVEAALGALPDLIRAHVTWDTARIGAGLRVQTRLPLPDALILASGVEHRAQAMITNDRKWQSRRLPYRILVLDDYL
jgi:predicted nucleic acid-binding protein